MAPNNQHTLTGAAFLLIAHSAIAQWCVPTTLIPYDSNMPGITRFQLSTIDRTSAADEHYPNNNYTYTGLSTTLVKGASYPATITFTIDGPICPDMNLRVWIDLNHDGQLDDPGETVLTVDHRVPPSYTATITIPATATTGTTRMRVTAKMSNLGGHILPTPCDEPPDAIGYHGEMEDYDVNIVAATGIDEVSGPAWNAEVFPSPVSSASVLRIELAASASMRIETFDALGRSMTTARTLELGQGEHLVPLDGIAALPKGTYYLRLTSGSAVQVVRLAVAG